METLGMEAWRPPFPRNPALCVKGIPLPALLPKAERPEAEEAQISCEYAQIKDLQLCLKTGKCVHAEDISELQEAIQEALRRANNDPEVRILEIIDQVSEAA
jgi:hypothetical protein